MLSIALAFAALPVLADPRADPVTPRTVLVHHDAEYPEAARAAGSKGTVVLVLTLSRDGSIDEVHVERSAGELLDTCTSAASPPTRARTSSSRCVVEGTFDPRQGNCAAAASVDDQLGLDRRGLTARYTHGSWNTDRPTYRLTAQAYAAEFRDAGELREDAYFTVDLTASLRWSRYEVAVGVTNALDTRYELGQSYDASDWHTGGDPALPAAHFSAGAPRFVYVTVGATFGEGG